MPSETLIAILEDIRDRQKEQIANFETALGMQEQALELHRRGRRILLFLVIMPWVLAVALTSVLLIR